MIRRQIRIPGVLALVACLAVGACEEGGDPLGVSQDAADPAEAEAIRFGRAGFPGNGAFTVMTRNMYLGGDIHPVFAADFTNPLEVLQASATAWAQVQASNIPERAAAIADEIERERPDLVGIQEAFQFVELDLSSGAPVPVQLLDLLGSLQAELSARGLDYVLLSSLDNTSATLPVGADPGSGAVTRAVQFTDRIAVFASSQLDVDAVTSDHYAAVFPLAPGVELKRGWIQVDASYLDVPFHFINTHLETQGILPIHSGQAAELIGSVTAGLENPVIVVGDLNSDAAAGPGAPSWTPTYGDLRDAGFGDAWLTGRYGWGRKGFTCCQDPGLRNERSILDERIDFVLWRIPEELDGHHPRDERMIATRTRLVGDRLHDRTDSGLWPSDHAGIVASFSLARGNGRDYRR